MLLNYIKNTYQTAYPDRITQAGGGVTIFMSNFKSNTSILLEICGTQLLHLLHSFELLFPCNSLPTQMHLAFLFTTVTTGRSEYCDYSLKGMLDAVHGLHQLISQFSRNMQRPVCNIGVLSQTKTQPSLSLEVCCAMLAKCHQESCH